MDLKHIIKPALLLDKNKTLANIERMISKCKAEDLALRPHFKTHQSHKLASWFRSAGITKITVSSVDMARYFAADGWKDILIAFPYNHREREVISKLSRDVDITLTIPCPESASLLAASDLENISVMLKIDCGYGRSGMTWNDMGRIKDAISVLGSNKRIRLKGLLTHSGNTYKANNKEEVLSIYKDTVERMNICRDNTGSKDLIISVGDTPSASLSDSFKGLDELRPGNFVFYDLMQFFIGSCHLDNISVVCACPVVDISSDRKKAVIYGGAVHLSKENLRLGNSRIYGMAVSLKDNGWSYFDKPLYISSLSQEHGVIESARKLPGEFTPGGLIGVIPVHSCLTANLCGGYTLIDDGMHIDHMNAYQAGLSL